MKNLTIMFVVAVSLMFMLFVFPKIQTGLIILMTIDLFALFLYAMVKFNQQKILACQYALQIKRTQQLEQELLKEIEMSNTVITRKETTPTLTSSSMGEETKG